MPAGDGEIDFGKIRTVPFVEIDRHVSVDQFMRPSDAGESLRSFIDSLPPVLAAADFKDFQRRILEAVDGGKHVVAMMGAHVIKCGLSLILIDLIERGILTAIAMNGAGAVHDFEIAFFGETSENVAEGLERGTFGMSEETGEMMNRTIREAARSGKGFGEALGSRIIEDKAQYRDHSLMAAAVTRGIPVTVHIAIGTDIIHCHPSCDGGAIGVTTHEDFRRFCGVVAGLEKGVIMNLGSAVILPEVFLKALAVARNLGNDVADFTTADFDMIRHYRPAMNVVDRPTRTGGQGYAFTGHHEIMIPLLAASLSGGVLDKGRGKD